TRHQVDELLSGMNVSALSLEAVRFLEVLRCRPKNRFCPKNKNAGLVGPVGSLSFICGELDWFRHCPRGSCKTLRFTASPKKIPLSSNYITSARFSSSFCRTGRAQPAISTRLTASLAACGDTP